MTITLIILLITGIFFVWGKFRADVVTLMALLTLALFNILTPSEAISGFSNPIVLMLAGLFIIAGAINQTGLAKKISTYLLQLAGKSQLKLFVITLLVTAFFSSFMSNYGTVALLLPIIVSMTREADLNVRRFLIPTAFASSMGGMMTLIGAPANLIVNDALIKHGLSGLGFFTVLPIGVILLVVGIIFLWFRSKSLENEEHKKTSDEGGAKSPFELVKEYQLANNLFRIKVEEGATILNEKLKNLAITQRYNVTIVEVKSFQYTTGKFLKSSMQYLVDGESIININDIIYVEGEYEDVERFVTENNLHFLDAKQPESDKPEFSAVMKFDEIGVAEAVVLSSSNLINKRVKETAFRKRYHINILGIKRKNDYILNQIQNEKIFAGDSLLIQGKWTDMNELSAEETDLIIVGQPIQEANKVILEHKAGIAAAILVSMVLSITFNILSPVIAILVAALLTILTGCFRNVDTAYKSIRWQNIIFFAAMLPMATAMDKTGASETISRGLVGFMGSLGPHAVLAALYFTTSLFTMFVSNTATVIIFAPIAIQSAIALGVSPYPFVLAVATAGAMCLASPYSTPPNSLVISPGRYTFIDYVKVGLPLQIIYILVMVFALPLLYPF